MQRQYAHQVFRRLGIVGASHGSHAARELDAQPGGIRDKRAVGALVDIAARERREARAVGVQQHQIEAGMTVIDALRAPRQMQIIIDVVAARALARALDVVIARDRLDVGEQSGLPEGRDDGERFVQRARRRVVHEITRDQQNAIGNVREVRHRLADCGTERLGRRQQPA